MHLRALVIATVVAPLIVGPTQVGAQQTASVVKTLSWISGCWQQKGANGRLNEEQWMAPRGETMLGMARTVRGDSLVEYEQLRIFQRAGKAVYHAMPSGQTPAEFTAAAVSDTLVVFENPQHDYPQRIIYRRFGADSMVARIEGTMNGRFRGIDFPHSRARCTGS